MSKLGISTGTTPNDGTGDTLLIGAVKINSNFDEIYNYFGDGNNLTFTGGGTSSQWVTTGVGIHTLSNVGIGTTNPTSALTVKGNTSLETLNVSATTFTNQLVSSGVVTATTFVGNLTGNVTGTATGLSGSPNLNVGVVAATRLNISNDLLVLPRGTGKGIHFGVPPYDDFNNDSVIFVSDSAGLVTGTLVINSGNYFTRFANTSGIEYVNNAITWTSISSETSYIGGYSNTSKVGIGSTQPTSKLDVSGDGKFTGIVTATSFSGSNTLKERTVVSGITTEIANNGIGNTNLTGYKSYALMKVGLSTEGWLRLYTDSASRTADVSRSVGEDPAPGSGVIAEVVTTGISTTQIISPFVMGGNLDDPSDTTIYVSITNLSGVTTSISVNLTLLQLEV